MAYKTSKTWPSPFLLYDSTSSLAFDYVSLPNADPSFSNSTRANFGLPNSSTRAYARVVINGLPHNISEQSLRLMFIWSQDLVSAEICESRDRKLSSAMLEFKTMRGAQEAKQMLCEHNNVTNETKMEINILPSKSRPTSPRHPVNYRSPKTFSSTSPVADPAVNSRFNHLESSFPVISVSTNRYNVNESAPLPFKGSYMPPLTTSGTPYQSLAPALRLPGNHIQDQPRVSGKHLIKANYTDDDDDDITALISNPRAYADNCSARRRRPTTPKTPSPINSPTDRGYCPNNQQHRSLRVLAVSPADQNPPCNTLYVGNLPMNAKEDELKEMFSKQQGYKHLFFRNKSNRPICFVQFGDITSAAKTLDELYGVRLHNSGRKGGIRLSFSKNPLGVRSGSAPGTTYPGIIRHDVPDGASIGFTPTSGPSPELTALPGLLAHRSSYIAATVNGSYLYNQGILAGSSNYPWDDPIHGYGMATEPGRIRK